MTHCSTRHAFRVVSTAILVLIFGCGANGGGGEDTPGPTPTPCFNLPSFSPASLGRLPGLNGPMGVLALSGCDHKPWILVAEEQSGELSRIKLDSGEVGLVAGGLTAPFGVVLEPGSQQPTVLVTAEQGLLRVNLNTKVVTTLAALDRPTGLLIDPTRPETVLVLTSANLYRVTRATGAAQLVVNHPSLTLARGIGPSERPGVFLVARGDTFRGHVARVDLSGPTPVVTDLVTNANDLRTPFGFDLGVGGNFAYVTAQAANQLARLEGLASGAVTLHPHIDDLKGPTGLGRLTDGRLVVAQHSTNDVVVLDPGACVAPPCAPPAPTVAGLGTPGDLVIEGLDAALVLERNNRDTSSLTSGTLSRVHTKTGKVTLIASGLAAPEAVILLGRTAFVAERGAIPNSATGRLLMVNIDSGVTQLVPSAPLSTPSGLAVVDPATLVVTERGAQKLSLLTVPNGAVTPVPLQTPIAAPLGIAMAADGIHAYVTDTSAGALYKVQVTGCTEAAPCPVQTVATSLSSPSGVALEPAGTSALVVTNAPGTAGGAVVRVFLQGPVPPSPTSTIARGLSNPQRIVIEPGGTTALVTETDPDGITRIALPAP